MPTTFPTAVDAFVDPTPGQSMNAGPRTHSQQHDDLNDAMVAVQTRLLAVSSATSSTGAALVGFNQSGTGAVSRTLLQKARERVSVADFGAVGDGITDDSAAILAALTAVGLGGQAIIPQGMRCYINSALQVPNGCTLAGDAGPWRGYANDATTFYSIGPAIHVGASGKVVLHAGASVEDLIIIRAGMAFPAFYADALAWTGRGVEAAGDNWSVVGCSIFGFNQGIYSSGYQRPRVENVQGDCWNGIYVGNNFDVGVISDCHFWPFLSAYSAPPTVMTDNRRGNAYYLDGTCDWMKLDNNFCFGYLAGYTINGSDYVTLTACSADNITAGASYYVGSVGFTINAGSTGIQLIGCQAAAQETGWSVNAGAGNTVSIIGGVYFGNRVNAGLHTSGELILGGGCVLRGQGALGNGLNIANGSARAIVDQVYIEDFAAPGIPINCAAAVSGLNVQLGRITYLNCAAPIGGAGSYAAGSVASAGSLVIPANGSVFSVTGAVSIGNFVTNVWATREITLIFGSALTLVNSVSLSLAGNVNATVTANSTMTFVYNGGVWFEKCRAIH